MLPSFRRRSWLTPDLAPGTLAVTPGHGGASHRCFFLLGLLAGLATVLVLAPGAAADVFTPESGGSPNADDTDSLYKIVLYVGILIFLIVEGTLIWSLVR